MSQAAKHMQIRTTNDVSQSERERERDAKQRGKGQRGRAGRQRNLFSSMN